MVRSLMTLGVVFGAKRFTEIRQCRKAAWNVITQRRHEVLRVYTNSPEQDDLMLLGEISIVLKNDRQLRSPFAARLVLDYTDSTSSKIKYYEPFAVSEQSEDYYHSIH